jgi:beta-aspartyl-peptidase (threonine type)
MSMALLANDESAAGFQIAMLKLMDKCPALDAVERGIRAVEADTQVDSVGAGGFPNMLGEVECDAAVMCGRTLRTGAVGGLKNFLHAISVARQVMERLPHVLLVGEGAEKFAAEIGAEKARMLTPEKQAEHEEWYRKHRGYEKHLTDLIKHSVEAQNARGTSIILALDRNGQMAGGASSSGWMYKYPGRIGDSAVVGAGLYVDERYGGAACTHTGEMTIRAGTARAVVAYMKKGATVEEACNEAMDDLLALKGGYLATVALHAMDKDGKPYVISTDPEDGYSYWTDSMEHFEEHKATAR